MKDAETRLKTADVFENFEYLVDYSTYYKRYLGIIEPEGIELNNRSKLISDEEIEGILELLHSDYRTLNISIDIHGSRFHTIKKWLNPTNSLERQQVLIEGFKRKIGGFQSGKEIVLFAYLYKYKLRRNYREEYFKLLLIQALLHEIRHAYQMVYMKKKYKKAAKEYINAGHAGYGSQWIERDANSFMQRVMNNNKEKINEILGIDFEWNCIWGSFKVLD